MYNKITREMMKEAKKAATPEELMKMAAEQGIKLSAEEAGIYYARLHKSGELSDDEIDSVAGGSCKDGSYSSECSDFSPMALISIGPEDSICIGCRHYYGKDNFSCELGHEKVF